MSKNPRYTLPIDAIVTIPPTDPLAFMAAKMGFKIGTNSSQRKVWQKPENWNWAFPLTFLDCEFKKYDHGLHLEACQVIRPKYTVVRDIMTSAQCDEMGIEHFDFDTVMKFAQDIEPYAENVILVPKYDCLSDIPERFIIGRAMSKYGKFHLDMNLLTDRRVHLLGGSWKKIRRFLEIYDSVVSFDCNNMWRVSVYGTFCYPDGQSGNLESCGFSVTSPIYASMILSLGHMAYGLHEVYETGANKKKEKIDDKQPKLF